MPSEKFRKLLRDVSKLKEAKKICENAGYKVRSNSINESMYRRAIANNIKQVSKYLSSSDDDFQYGRALCDILFYCTEGFAYFCNEYLEKNPENANKIASRVSDQIDDIKTAMNDLYDFVDEL